jgi:hypothetical protein
MGNLVFSDNFKLKSLYPMDDTIRVSQSIGPVNEKFPLLSVVHPMWVSLRRTVVNGKTSQEESLTFPLILVCAVAMPPVQNIYTIIIRCNTLFMTFLIIDGKDSANRVEKKQVCLIFYPEVQPML